MLPNETQIPDTTLAATGLSRGLSPFVGCSPARGPQRAVALSGDIDLELHEDRRVIALDHLETIPARDGRIRDLLTIRGLADFVPDPIEPADIPGLAVFVP